MSQRDIFVLASTLIMSSCSPAKIEASSAGITEADARTFVDVQIRATDYEALSRSGEALHLNVHSCAEDGHGAIPFALERREPLGRGPNFVLVRFVVSAHPTLRRHIDEKCGFLSSDGYSLKDFRSDSFRIQPRR